jgi:hypothetical protein
LLHRLVQRGRFSRAKVAATLGEVVAGREPLSTMISMSAQERNDHGV